MFPVAIPHTYNLFLINCFLFKQFIS